VTDNAHLVAGDTKIDLPIIAGSEGEIAVDIGRRDP